MLFKQFSKKINEQFNTMVESDVFVVDITKEQLWDTYQSAFPEGTNNIYVERPKHDCNCCKQFVRNIGAMVTIVDNKLVTVWDIEVDSFYQEVADKLSTLVKSASILSPFKRSERKYGVKSNQQLLESGDVITWNHFHCDIPANYLSDTPSKDIASTVSTEGVLRRGLQELSMSSLLLVQDLITDGQLYLGDSFAKPVAGFIKLHKQYNKKKTVKSLFTWQNSSSQFARFKNTVIGTLVEDLTKGTDPESAVKSFESKTAPTNYKRSSSVITQGMIDNATAKIDELGIEPALHRRLATTDDVSVNNVIYGDQDTKQHMKGGIADLLAPAAKKTKVNTKNVTDITIDDFVDAIIPVTDSLEMNLSNAHKGNLMTLVAPTDPEAQSILKWDNNFTWSYNGNITDSMKDRVKSAGGKVDGILRFSIQWNEDKQDQSNDLDAHCVCPQGHICYNNKESRLDVDITNPGNKTAVENITWPTHDSLTDGKYKFHVVNYRGRNTNGFRAEVEIDGVTHTFDYPRSVTSDVDVATVTYKDGKFSIETHLDSKQSSKNIYGIPTETFHKVSMVMLSPNFWDNQEIGNKHHFFILDKCNADEPVNGFYNEFLSNNLNENRKVFEVLSSKMRCPVSNSSLSGLGFSSTVRNSVLAKANGRTYNIKF